MKTLIIAGGEINKKILEKYQKEYNRTKYNSSR